MLQPLESLKRTKPLADPLLSYASASIKAANPCYFYYNSYCKKGDNCPFLHEPITHDVVGVSSEALTSNLAKNSNPAGNEMIESSKDALANPCQGSPDRTKDQQPGVPNSSSPKHNGFILNAPQTSVDTVGYMKSSTLSDQSSGDSAIEHSEDTSRDSSPGFDVLVDDGLSSKIDLEHQSTQERDTEVLHLKHHVGDSIGYSLDYHDAEYNEQGLHGFEHGSFLNYFEGFQGHGCMTTSGHILHNTTNLVNPSCEEHVPIFFNPRSLMGSHAGSDNQNSQIRHISMRPPERRGAKGNDGRIKRCRIREGRNAYEQTDTRPTHDMQNSLTGDCSRPFACATFRGQKKKSRKKQRHVRSARPSKYSTANVKHLDPREFIGPKTLAQIKEEKCRSKSSASHPAAHMPHGRSSSNDFEGPKSLSELLKVKGRTSVDKGIML